jgi:hypothetical protein
MMSLNPLVFYIAVGALVRLVKPSVPNCIADRLVGSPFFWMGLVSAGDAIINLLPALGVFMITSPVVLSNRIILLAIFTNVIPGAVLALTKSSVSHFGMSIKLFDVLFFFALKANLASHRGPFLRSGCLGDA